MVKTAVYLRVSEDRQGNELAVKRQREDCLKVCEHQGWTPVEYVDNDTSATTGKRPAYEGMLADIRAGEIQAVVAWDLDRLHRRPIELELFMELADEYKLKLATVTGEVDLSTDNGRLFARIKGAVAKAEVERKSARQKRAMLQKAQAGEVWGPRAFGYNEDRTKLVAQEANAIRRAYSSVLAGVSLYAIANEMNAKGLLTSKGYAWKGKTVREALLNPRYAGLRTYGDEIVGPAKWKAVVSEDVWRSVCRILKDPQRQAGHAARSHLLSGLALCGNCGTTLSAGIKRRTDGYVLVCKGCHRLSRAEEPIDAAITGLAIAYLSRPDAVDLLVDRDREDMGELRESERAILEQMETLASDRYVEELITDAQFRAANGKLTARLADVRDRMLDANRARTFDGLVGAEDVEEVWQSLPLERKRAVIAALFTVTILPIGRGQKRFSPDQLQINWLTAQD